MEVSNKTVIEAIASVASYNCWSQTLHKMREYLVSQIVQHHKTRYWAIPFPSDILHQYDPDVYPRIIWFILVEMYGDCGTSPRVGWINGETSRDALQWLSELCDLCDAFNGDGDE